MTTLTTEQKIAAAGYTMQEAREFITAVVDRPSLIAQKAAEAGLNLADLAHIVNVGVGEVVNYFATAGVDVNAVNGQKTNLSLVSDLQSGDVYLYDPINAIGRKAFSFGTQITDIATAFNGDVYATTFSGLYRYDFATKKVEFVASLPMGANSLDIHGTSLIEASSNDNVVRFLDEGGHQYAAYSLPGGAAGGDVLVQGNQLYRTTGDGIMRTDMRTGVTTREVGEVGAKYHGLAEATWGWIVGYANDGEVKAYNPVTHDVMNLPKLTLSGVSPSGATEALQMQVDAWA